MQDVPAICAAAKARGVATLIDNTWATPLYLPALALGVDISILACTKYIGGHADLMLGSVTATEAYATAPRAHPPRPRPERRPRRGLARPARPQDPLRPPRAPSGERPEGRPLARGRSRRSPASSTPRSPPAPATNFSCATSRARPACSPSVLQGGDDAAAARFIERLTLFGIGWSWGAFESLAVPGRITRTATAPRDEGPLVRLHIGLEDPEDLIEDLAQALAAWPG